LASGAAGDEFAMQPWDVGCESLPIVLTPL
jgi:hypothetical protein